MGWQGRLNVHLHLQVAIWTDRKTSLSRAASVLGRNERASAAVEAAVSGGPTCGWPWAAAAETALDDMSLAACLLATGNGGGCLWPERLLLPWSIKTGGRRAEIGTTMARPGC